ncbi:MAG: NUDIX domain-containing protein [Candidatus Micrarchaeota archaeon]|nr:NUDIX domain-containing protein [Candidatus Micrarchaeota archaeon]
MEKSCGAVIYRVEGGKRLYLLLHYQEGHWDFPKGHVEEGESEEETVRREVREETGIYKLEFEPLFRERIGYFFKREGKTVQKEVIFFLASTKEKEVWVSSEHVGFAWLSYQEALKRLTYKNAKEVLKKAEARLSA